MAKPGSTPKWRKSPPELAERFQQIANWIPNAQVRKMFGYPCAFINGQMLCGLHQESMILRLAEKDRASFIAEYHTRLFEPMTGRPMKEYVVVPPDMVDQNEILENWLLLGAKYVSSLPPKTK